MCYIDAHDGVAGWLCQVQLPLSGPEDGWETIMKTAQLVTNVRLGKPNRAPRQTAPRFADRKILLSPARTERSRIQWPTGQQMRDVSKQLARISREGRRCELAGDYFKSGDLAFQTHEIIRATTQLFEKSRRTRT